LPPGNHGWYDPFRLNHSEEDTMKHYDCLVPGCKWHTEATDSAEIVRRAAEHLQQVHEESMVRPEMIGRIKERIVEAEPAR
jgi:predicted small metal-binding protein